VKLLILMLQSYFRDEGQLLYIQEEVWYF